VRPGAAQRLRRGKAESEGGEISQRLVTNGADDRSNCDHHHRHLCERWDSLGGEEVTMAANKTLPDRAFHALASLKTGITLLILVGLASAAGTFILQRPLTDPDDMVRAYSPATLQLLDRLRLTDIFHAPWFILLMAALAVSIVCASLERWPKAWRMVARPYLRTDSHFRAVLPMQAHFPAANASQALLVAEKAMKQAGLRPRRVVENEEVSIYAERNLLSVFAVYVVHASLLLILAGGIIDAIWGYHGFLMLTQGQSTGAIEIRTGETKKLPFTLRCDGAGQENYPDGSPKKWWSDLSVIEGGKVTVKKQIIVNDPLVIKGIRFYQSSYGQSGELERARLYVTPQGGSTTPVIVTANQPAQLPDGGSIRIASFLPDAAVRDGEIYAKSNMLNNPAFELQVQPAKAAAEQLWLIPGVQPNTQTRDGKLTIGMQSMDDVRTLPFTGLQVSHEPGQWAVWSGCVLMALGLILAFYLVHQRYWATTFEDPKTGQTVLWIGTIADKNREHFQELFDQLAKQVRELAEKPARELTHA
jgi:cytochrome c biogenesis protein